MKMKRDSIFAGLILALLALGGCSSHGAGCHLAPCHIRIPTLTAHAARQNPPQSSAAKLESRNTPHARSGRR